MCPMRQHNMLWSIAIYAASRRLLPPELRINCSQNIGILFCATNGERWASHGKRPVACGMWHVACRQLDSRPKFSMASLDAAGVEDGMEVTSQGTGWSGARLSWQLLSDCRCQLIMPPRCSFAFLRNYRLRMNISLADMQKRQQQRAGHKGHQGAGKCRWHAATFRLCWLHWLPFPATIPGRTICDVQLKCSILCSAFSLGPTNAAASCQLATLAAVQT